MNPIKDTPMFREEYRANRARYFRLTGENNTSKFNEYVENYLSHHNLEGTPANYVKMTAELLVDTEFDLRMQDDETIYLARDDRFEDRHDFNRENAND